MEKVRCEGSALGVRMVMKLAQDPYTMQPSGATHNTLGRYQLGDGGNTTSNMFTGTINHLIETIECVNIEI